ncbi:MAG: esterase/lipase family protein [Rhodoferax sp.]
MTAFIVFGWRMPFASNRVPDGLHDAFGHRGRRGVVFLHGFICNRGLWTPWMLELTQQRRAFVAVNLEPVFGSIDAYAMQVEEAVDKVTAATGMPPIMICHSMGGLAARAWLRAAGGNGQRVHHIITIGTPHHGTVLGGHRYPVNAMQMGRHSAWLLELGESENGPLRALFTCYYSNSDNIVFPASTATLEGADNRLVPGVPHLALA